MESEFENSLHLQTNNAYFDELLQPLLQTRPWVMLCAILGFVSSGIMIIFGLLFMLGMSDGMLLNDLNQAGFGSSLAFMMGALYFVMGVVFALPALWLFRYAKSIRLAERSKDTNDIISALRFQKSFWKFIGICISLYLAFMVLSLITVAIGTVFSD